MGTPSRSATRPVFISSTVSEMHRATALVLLVGTIALAAAMPTSQEFCWHKQDVTDGKCFQACKDTPWKHLNWTKGPNWGPKDFPDPGPCPMNYNVTPDSKPIKICGDGVNSLRYCPAGETITVKWTK